VLTRRQPARLGAVALTLLLLGSIVPTASATTIVRATEIAAPAASAIVPGSVNRTSIDLRATYQTTLNVSYATRSFRVDSTATITNESGGRIDRVELNTIAAKLGGIRLTTVTVDGQRVTPRISGQTILVPLGGVLPDGATATVRVAYASTLRTSLSGSSWLFTKVNGILGAYRWLPWVSRARPFDRPNHGDPFYTPVSPLVRLTVNADRRLVVATSGEQTGSSPGGWTSYHEARNVRDMTFTAAPDYRTRSTTVGDTTIRYYYRSSTNAARILDAAADAFRAIQSRLGDYPYRTFKVVQSPGGYGMESPALIWIPYGVSSANIRYLVAHETAHQWFYGLVGNDQSRQPFADEAAADFMGRFVTSTRRSSRCSSGRLDLDIYHYSATCYYERIYIQGGNLIDEARRRMGSTAFWRALKGYVAANRYGLVTNETLLDALDAGTSLNLGASLFDTRFPSIY
jgi:hypothetical protein